MPHIHPVVDNDLHFVINPVTREIINESKKIRLMQGDHASEIFTFEIPRFVDGHDMSLCNKIGIHYINVGSSSSYADVHLVSDVKVNDTTDKVTFSWLIYRTVTQYAGTLNFLIKFSCTDDDGIITYQWNTDIFKGITISSGMDNEESMVEDITSDLLESWKNSILAEVPNLAPQTVKKIESLDVNNMVVLRDLDSGSYILYGHFEPYADADSTMTFGSNLLVNIIKGSTLSEVQILYPKNNCVQYLNITDTTYERTNVYLNSLESTDNRVTSIDTNSDDAHYPTAKAVYTAIEIMTLSESEVEELIAAIGGGSMLNAEEASF